VTTSPITRLSAALAAAALGVGLSTVSALASAGPAAAAGVGYVRLAHLSPDTPPVDVYLSSVSAPGEPQKFPAVPYGVVSKYLPVPVGTYSVAMRNVGASAASPPVLSQQVVVAENGAYTVAGVGRFADLGLRVLTDDLALPAAGRAKVRIVQASARAPVLDVSVAGGAAIANGVAFATTTDYREVNPGQWTLQLKPVGAANATTRSCTIAAGSVYSVLVLDNRSGGLSVEVRIDARSGESMPLGGVDTGRGGTAGGSGPVALLGSLATAVVVAGLALGLLAYRRRRTTAESR